MWGGCLVMDEMMGEVRVVVLGVVVPRGMCLKILSMEG